MVADGSADLVLRARLGLLRSSLTTVQRALTDLDDCRKTVRGSGASAAASLNDKAVEKIGVSSMRTQSDRG